MHRFSTPAFALLLCLASQTPVLLAAPETKEFTVAGLEGSAEIRVDQYGVPHIYANHHYDAFYVQGFNAARDRLWQIDLWRRRGLGQLSEILGPNFVEQDKAARLFLYRGSMFREWLAYGSDAKRIASAFTAGINAYVELIRQDAVPLPVEFSLLDYKPAIWNPEDVVRIRSNGLWRNVISEVQRAYVVCQHGLKVDAFRSKLEPAWQTRVPEGLDPCDIPLETVKLYALAQAPVDFTRAHQFMAAETPDVSRALAQLQDNLLDAGSNNWAVSAANTSTGRPILANDPHRGHAVPSLRYIAHLVAPGLNVIGAGEPALPGISIGHNEDIAFGLTIFSIDQEDLVVYQTQEGKYQYMDSWVEPKIVSENIKIKGKPDETLELKFTRDGPIIHEDEQASKAFAVRAAWLEPGMAPYFGSVEYMRASNWDQFLGALNRWGAPSENQVYADTKGNIGYKPAGLTPIRKNYDGLLPVPGDGRYEWHGFYDMDQLPVEYNPASGFVATANAMSLPEDYPYKERIIGFEWANPWRIQRIREVLKGVKPHTMKTSIELQRDYLSIPARRILTHLDPGEMPEVAAKLFSGWDYRLEKNSAAAVLFEVWFSNYLVPAVFNLETGVSDPLIGGLDKLSVVERFETMAAPERQALALLTLRSAIIKVTELLGGNPQTWAWGDLHLMKFEHPLLTVTDEKTRELLKIPVVSRGGSGDTPNSTRYRGDFTVASGGSWRMVVDVGNWDAAVMTNAPGQSGDPNSPWYHDMLEMWASDASLPLLYSRDKIVASTRLLIRLKPAHE